MEKKEGRGRGGKREGEKEEGKKKKNPTHATTYNPIWELNQELAPFLTLI